MRRAGITGEVVVDFVVDIDGEVKFAAPVRSSRKEFEAAAVAAVSKWKFKPGQKGGRDVPTHLQVPIVFSLAGQTVQTSAPTPGTSGASETGNSSASPGVQLSNFHVVSPAPEPAASPSAPPRE
jgi:TonB family protein